MSAYLNTRLSAGLLLAGSLGFGTGFVELRLNAQPTAEITWNGESVVVTLHGTETGKNYQILSKADLVSGSWVLEQDVGGAEGQDRTQTTVPMEGRPTLYMIAGYGEDSDGDGLSDVYEILVTRTSPDSPDTGNTGVLDTYKDPDGDEWTNLHEYRLRTDPLKFDPPRAPANVRATMDQGATTATLRWDPLDGAVLEYIVERETFPWSEQYEEIGRVAGSQVAFVDSQPDPYKRYRVAARYQPGNSSFSQNVRVNQADVRLAPAAAAIIRGPLGQHYLAVSALPQVAASLRISRITNRAWYPLFDYDPNFSPTSYFPENRIFPDDTSSATMEIPVSQLSNGVYPIPSSFAPDFGRYRFSIEVITPDGTAGEALSLASSQGAFNLFEQNKIPFLDGAAHLKQNLMFWLKAANASETFRYSIEAGESEPSYYHFVGNPNYAYVDFHRRDGIWNRPFPDNELVIDEFRPFQENRFLRNWIYQSGHLDGLNNINTGVGYDWLRGRYHWCSREGIFNERYFFPVYDYVTSGNQSLLQPALPEADTQWIYHEDSACPETWEDPRIGVTRSVGNLQLASGLRNVFGLAYISLKIGSGYEPYPISTVFYGQQYSDEGFTYFGSTFQEVENPVLQTESYYFAGSGDPMPGDASWDVNNQTPLLIAPAGQLFTVAGWAKQRIVNGYTNKFAYLGQYFDKAFKVDPTTGQRTTQETGLLSEYGEFFPTEPGRVILTTKPDADQGNLQGECLIHVIKMELDVNHDGKMDLSLAGPDNTSQTRPYVFWINNDRDEPETSAKPDLDLESYFNRPDSQDWYHGRIRSKRNLEDFARIWISELPTFPDSYGYTVELSMAASSGNPAINLYAAFDPEGGAGYLTDTNAAQRQFAQYFFNEQLVFEYARKLKTINSSQSYAVPISLITRQPLYTHFLFEGAGRGSGQLVLTVYKGTNIMAQTSAWLDLRDVKELYETAVVSNVQQQWPEMVQENRVSGFQVIHSPDPALNTAKEMVIFVHGWRMSEWGFLNYSETLFKRLYWQGFQGRFATLGWPTRSADTDPFFHLDVATYNRSEYIAFKSASGTAAYLNHLRNRFADYTISVCAHSMGNIVMMETLKQLADQGKAPIDNYVFMQAAVPAHCYDTTVANLPFLLDTEQKVPTPDTYRNYAAGITRALRGRGQIVNFFNRLDFALNTWVLNQLLYIPDTNGPVTMKPCTFLGYYTDGTRHLLRTNSWNQDFLSISYGGYYDGPTRAVTNLVEVMPFVSRPRGLPVGAQGGTRGMVSAELNLETQLGFGDKPYDHSGQFNRNIQERQVGPFYDQLKRSLFPPAP